MSIMSLPLVRAIVLFIREHLDNPNMKFHLYTSPPKSVLRGGKRTLEEAGLVPAAVIYFGTDDPPSDGDIIIPFWNLLCY